VESTPSALQIRDQLIELIDDLLHLAQGRRIADVRRKRQHTGVIHRRLAEILRAGGTAWSDPANILVVVTGAPPGTGKVRLPPRAALG
jgi:hypothetical protein